MLTFWMIACMRDRRKSGAIWAWFRHSSIISSAFGVTDTGEVVINSNWSVDSHSRVYETLLISTSTYYATIFGIKKGRWAWKVAWVGPWRRDCMAGKVYVIQMLGWRLASCKSWGIWSMWCDMFHEREFLSISQAPRNKDESLIYDNFIEGFIAGSLKGAV